MWYFMLIIKKTIKVGLNEMIYFIIYAVPSWLLIMFGMMNQYAWYTLGGFWYFTYGLAYFLSMTS
jgi:beta-carotene 3-hydroxylase